MSQRKRNLKVVGLSLMLAALSMGWPSPAAHGQEQGWRAAAGAVAITPTGSMWMAGYASRTAPSEGAVHDLFAKALVLEDSAGTRFAIITTDLIGIPAELRTDVERLVGERCKLAPSALLMNASHTHCGPELREQNAAFYGGPEQAVLSREYLRQLGPKIADLVAATIDKLAPATLSYRHARAGFAMNRRLPDGGGFANSPNPDGPVDHTVPVLRVDGTDGALVAVLFGYACHNTTLGFQQFCGDYAGFAQADIEARHPGTIALFLTGCGADQNPYPRGKLELAQDHGRALANAVEVALETKRVRPVRGPLRLAYDQVTLRFATPPAREQLEQERNSNDRFVRRHAERLLEQIERDGEVRVEYPFPLQVAQFGDDLTLVAISGETVVDYAIRLRRELESPANGSAPETAPALWTAGYSNHVFGYLPSRRVLEEGGYEGGGAMRYTAYPGPFAEDVEERVMAKIQELVQQTRSSAQK